MRKKFGFRTLEATYLVRCWPGSTHNGISGHVGRWRQTGQDAVNRALSYGLIENRGTPYCFALYVTDKGRTALDNAWPLFSDDASRNPQSVEQPIERPAGSYVPGHP